MPGWKLSLTEKHKNNYYYYYNKDLFTHKDINTYINGVV